MLSLAPLRRGGVRGSAPTFFFFGALGGASDGMDGSHFDAFFCRGASVGETSGGSGFGGHDGGAAAGGAGARAPGVVCPRGGAEGVLSGDSGAL